MTIGHVGRGRMSLEDIKSDRFARVYDGIELPKHVKVVKGKKKLQIRLAVSPTKSHPESTKLYPFTLDLRFVRLEDFRNLVSEYVKSARSKDVKK